MDQIMQDIQHNTDYDSGNSGSPAACDHKALPFKA
jgi:hypothetical protein